MLGPLFTDVYRYAKFAEYVRVKDPTNGNIIYFSNKPTNVNSNPSVTTGEIRAGVGNGIVAMIPSDTSLGIEIEAADFNLLMRAYQAGGKHGYGAPTWTCAAVTASGTSLTVPVATTGTPIAEQGYSTAYCYVQEVAAGSSILSDGVAYEISAAGVISGFTATSGKTYKVWFHVNSASTEYVTLTSNFDPAVVNLEYGVPVYANSNAANATNNRVGTLVCLYPFFKLNGSGAGVGGSSSANTTTGISGMAIGADQTAIGASCDPCADAAPDLCHYLFIPCDGSNKPDSMVILGGYVSVAKGGTATIPVYLVVNGQLVAPDPAFLSYSLSSAPSGTTVSDAGVISAGSTAGTCTVTVTYTESGATSSLTAQGTVEVLA